MNEFRTLNADEIDVRIATIKSNGISLLLYKDARCDQNLLDETVGSYNWQRSHQIIDGNLYCTVSIYDPHKQAWVSKQDVGTESYTEKEKGQASDSFKRACFNWGIGRELYSAPFIWVPSSKCEIKEGKCFDKFEVAKIDYNPDGEISELLIINSSSRNEVFKWSKKEKPTETFSGEKKITATDLKIIAKKCKEDKIPESYVCELYGTSALAELNEEKMVNLLGNWDKLKAKYNERTNS